MSNTDARPGQPAARSEPEALGGGHGRAETELERWDRNFNELLQELRVAQTGVQILFGFLLILPFSARFGYLTTTGKAVYVVTLGATAVAAATLIAPVGYHRLVFRRGRKPELVRVANRLALMGLTALLIAIVGAVFLVIYVVYNIAWAAVFAAVTAGICVGLWYALPAVSGRRNPAAARSADPGAS